MLIINVFLSIFLLSHASFQKCTHNIQNEHPLRKVTQEETSSTPCNRKYDNVAAIRLQDAEGNELCVFKAKLWQICVTEFDDHTIKDMMFFLICRIHL